MKVLDAARVPYRFQVEIDYYIADFVIGDRLILEADGERWHTDKARERKRDGYLKHKGYLVIHIPGEQIKKNAQAAVISALEQAIQRASRKGL